MSLPTGRQCVANIRSLSCEFKVLSKFLSGLPGTLGTVPTGNA